MQHHVGLDVSVKETSVCIVDKAGKVIREVKVATKPVPCCASFRVPFYSPIEVVGHRTCALFFRYVISPVIRLQFLDDPNDLNSSHAKLCTARPSASMYCGSHGAIPFTFIKSAPAVSGAWSSAAITERAICLNAV